MNHNNNHHLRSLCLYMPLADDQIVENLQAMIRCEQLFLQFTINRIVDNIHLQWK
jgi:hypothetical protein